MNGQSAAAKRRSSKGGCVSTGNVCSNSAVAITTMVPMPVQIDRDDRPVCVCRAACRLKRLMRRPYDSA